VEISRELYVRARFVGGLCLVLLAPLLLFAVAIPESLQYTVGVLGPFSYFAYRCLFGGSHNFSGTVTLLEYRFLYILSFLAAIGIHVMAGPKFAVAWYIAGATFVFGEPIARDVLTALGFGTRYSIDRRE
jgi:hypothetical protein